MIVSAYNPEVDDLEKTYLTAQAASGVGTLKVKNSNAFTNGRRLLVGSPERERSEMVLLNTKTTTQLTITGTTNFNHDPDDPVYLLDWDQLKIYRSTTGENGSYTILTTMDLDWDNADGQTKYDDANALSTYFYRVTYYNSITTEESPVSGNLPATGYPRGTVGSIIMDHAARIKDKNFMEFTIDEYIEIMNDVNDDLITRAKKPYRFLKKNLPIDVNPGDDSIPYPADLWKIDYVEVNTTSIAYPRGPKVLSPIDFRYRQNFNEMAADFVRQIAYDDETSTVLFWPAARTIRLHAFDLHYYQNFTQFTKLSDKVQTPNGLVYKLALKREFYQRKADDDSKYLAKLKDYDNRYETEVIKLQREKNIQADGPASLHPEIKRYRQ